MDIVHKRLLRGIKYTLTFLLLLLIILLIRNLDSGPTYYSKFWEHRLTAPNVTLSKLYDGKIEHIFQKDYDGKYLILAHRAECLQNSYDILRIANIKNTYDVHLVGVFYSEATFSHHRNVAESYLSNVVDIVPITISPYDSVYFDREHDFKDSFFPLGCNFGYIFDSNHKLEAFFNLDDKGNDSHLSKYVEKL